MMIRLLLVMSLLIFSGCAGKSVCKPLGNNAFEIELKDNGTMDMLNSSRLEQEWNHEARKICPGGYTVQSQSYVTEKAFEPARLTGIITCR
ncbi:MAG: hypothetical protein H6Q57_856 [Geobacteraceae bacterium]|nr:hypothetical protein [Geobacteraceae bacterium]